jgi:hypothetical protein
MHNYQLYRTNPRLSGQLKWDLIIDSYDGELYVDNMSLSPLSNSLPFPKYTKQDLLRYSHQENVCRFYKQNKNIFFNSKGDQKLDSLFPIISKTNDSDIDTSQFDSTYNMGVRRVSYKSYGKQFAILTPIWLEEITDTIKFKFDKYIGSTYIGTKYLVLRENEISQKTNHNRFSKYFFDYAKYTQLYRGGQPDNWKGDELISIDLKTDESSICGLHVTSGLKITKPILYLSRNLKNREMTMMEFDEKILSEFEKNGIICSQLFNFNFIFDIDDMLNEWEKQQFSHNIDKFNIKVHVEVKTGTKTETIKNDKGENITNIVDVFEQLPGVDFYNNYEYIQKVNSNGNVLDYLKDDKHLDLINKNKLCPTIFHWSLNDNDSYIFNLYDGFSAEGTSKNYDGAPNLFIEDYFEHLFNDKWMYKSINDNPFAWTIEKDSLDFLDNVKKSEIDKYTNRMTFFKSGIAWVNNVKYILDKDIYIGVFRVPGTSRVIEKLKYTQSGNNDFIPLIKPKEGEGSVPILTYRCDFTNGMPYFIFICLDYSDLDYSDEVKSHLTFANLIKKIPEFGETFKDFNRFENPPLITIEKSISGLIKADSPSLNSDEIRGYQWTHLNKYLYRYSGKLKPSFVFVNTISGNEGRINKLYYKTKLTQGTNTSSYNYYRKSKFPAKYPSLGYYPINSFGMSYLNKPSGLKLNNEDSWFNISNMMYLPTSMNWQIVYDQSNGEREIKGIVREKFRELYGDGKCDYIMSLYDYESSFDYESNTTVSKYKYDIKLTLK